MTGAQDALVVNNCAAAALLTLAALARDGETIVSRGELVEIGGDFRVPDVMAQSGTTMVEVGTTNRTRLSDYERAVTERTRLVLRVHPSNYRIVGFTSAPTLAELARLAHERNLLLYEDAGSGALQDLGTHGLAGEPVIRDSIAQGADVITFSGDKLLGSAQAGLVVGRREIIERLRRHPLYRALRADKLALSALEATLDSYRRGEAAREVPALRMLAATREELEGRARAFTRRLRARFGKGALNFEIIEGQSAIGGGGRVYCVAYDHDRRDKRTFAVDNVSELTVLTQTFTKPTNFSIEVSGKRFELLRELLPDAARVGVLVNPNNARVTQQVIESAQAAARQLGIDMVVLEARGGEEIKDAISAAVQKKAAALSIGTDAAFGTRSRQIAFLALRHGLPILDRRRWMRVLLPTG